MLTLTDSRTGEREPLDVDDEVLLYYCGLTTSDPAHVGHARGWVVVDVLRRWLEHQGHAVRHVENFTDVNEKIVARVGADGDSEAEVARSYVADLLRDMRALNLRRAHVYPRVSEHVPEIVDLVQRLVDQGYAYEADGSVYFDVTAFEAYGDLSNQDPEAIEAQGDPDELDEKRHPQDFALWKAGDVSPAAVAEHRDDDRPGEPADPGGQTWDSPWGEGRPGWHVECSAMSMTHLDETIDVHVGGADLVFPHHENEIAQSEAVTGQVFARHWLHVGLVRTDAEKMSSSLRNFTTVHDAVDEVGPDVLRVFLLSRSYRTPIEFDHAAIAEAETRVDRLERAYQRAVDAADSPDARTKVVDDDLRGAVDDTRTTFAAAMNDDLNTREATAALLGLGDAVDRHLDAAEYDYVGLRRAIEAFEGLAGDVLGLTLGADGGGADLASEAVDLLLEVREREREAGNYELADEVRDRLEAMGVEVEDTPDGPEFYVT
ncbi:cysteine--tRNA ligase [Halobacteriales archaeon SW_5_70_135]|nr:MAG: cysteine--tRNA ligase [Halobacteriales archaeon SW_5_70_135]